MRAILRYLIGTIFIVSGFVKAVDPIGFSFKLEEYFSASVFNIPFLEKYSLILSIIVVAAELILGAMLFLKIKVKTVLKILIALCIFFAFLTFYSAYFNKVTDCGCFGDAIKFTPWQSFAKDIILLAGLIILWFLYRKDPEIRNKSILKKALFLVSLFGTGFIIYYGIIREPLIDFRDYKIGTDLNAEKKKIAENPSTYLLYYTLKNSKTGEEKTVDQNEYINNQMYWKEGSPWKILDDRTESKLVKEGYSSEISKFNISDAQGNDLTQEILNLPKVYLVLCYNPSDIDKDALLKTENKLTYSGNTKAYGVAPDTDIFHKIPSATMDATAIKTIARSNPAVLTLEYGKITDKQPLQVFLEN